MQIDTAARNAMCDALVDLIDAGSAAGHIRFGTTGMATILSTVTLNDPAFGAASSGVAALDVDPVLSDTIDNTGTVAEFQIRDSNNNARITGSCGTSGADINFDSVSLVQGGTLTINSISITVPAS